MATNPFSPTATVTDDRGVFGDARLIRSGFLFRQIQIEAPKPRQLIYSGWWFLQRIWSDGQLAWWKISWLTIQRRVEFLLPHSEDQPASPGAIEIDFGPGLMIRRFRVWIDGQIVYDEIR